MSKNGHRQSSRWWPLRVLVALLGTRTSNLCYWTGLCTKSPQRGFWRRALHKIRTGATATSRSLNFSEVWSACLVLFISWIFGWSLSLPVLILC